MKNKSLLIGIILGIAYGLIARILIDFKEDDFFKTMTLSYIFVTPAIIGAITVYFGTEEQRKSWKFRITMPWVTIAAFLGLTFVFYLEATFCVALLFPAFMASASIGGLIMGLLLDKSARETLSIFLIFPLAIGTVEDQFNNPVEKHRVTTEIIINTDIEMVWENIKRVDSIGDGELKWSYAHFIGVPKPINSELSVEKIGGIRKINWAKGIKFKEVITEWQPERRFVYNIIVDTIPPNAIDPHVKIGGEYFSVISGGYELLKIDSQITKLTLYCDYEIATKFNFYSIFWANFLLDDFQNVILGVIKDRSEKKYKSLMSN